MQLAVVIPTLNEEAALGRALDSLAAQKDEIDSLVIADGGSSDGTLALARDYGATIVAVGRPGRGSQIAAALRDLDHDVVLVVHADMTVPSGALALVRERLAENPSCPGGCLGHRFDTPGRALRWTEAWDARRARRGISYGDQAQFFRRGLLNAHGGFPDQPILEDLELARRMKRLGSPLYLDCPVIVSARRYARRGWLRTTLANFLIRQTYRLFGLRACAAIYRYYYGRFAGERRKTGEP